MSEDLARRMVEAAHIELPQDWPLSRFGEELEFILAYFPIEDYRARIPSGKDALLRVSELQGHIEGIRAALCSAGDGIPKNDGERAILDLRSRIIARANLRVGDGANWFRQLVGSLSLMDSILADMEPSVDQIWRAGVLAEVAAKHRAVIEQWRTVATQACEAGEISEADKRRILGMKWLQFTRKAKAESQANKAAFRAMIRTLDELWNKVFGSRPEISAPAELRVGAADYVTPGQRFPLLVVAMADDTGCDRGIIPASPEALRKEIERTLPRTPREGPHDGLDN